MRFVNINVAEFDAFKHGGVPLLADARVALEQLEAALSGYQVEPAYARCICGMAGALGGRDRPHLRPPARAAHQPGRSHRRGEPRGPSADVVVSPPGSLPGDLHKLWRTRQPGGYHMEYGYSCMGYEIAGGLGIKMADPSRDVYVMVGDGSFLMMSSEIVTSIQEGYKLNMVVVDNHGYSSIGGLSHAIGSKGFGTNYRRRTASGQLDGENVPVDFAPALCRPGRAHGPSHHAAGTGAGARSHARRRPHHRGGHRSG